jgi:hypothetical protein
MSRPLKIKYSGGTFAGLQEMSDSEIDSFADLLLDSFTDNVGTGHLSVNTSTSWASIGTFSDTRRDQAVGTHPANTTIHTENYVFRQNLGSVSPSTSARPIEIKGVPFNGLQEMSDSDIVTNIINRVKAKIATFSPGTYKLQPSAPSGGTWTSVSTITNKTVSGNNTSTLWRRTDGVTSPGTRPLKLSSGALRELSNAEIVDLTDYFRSEIIASGVGKYQLATSAPSGGTWIVAGTGFSDDRHQRTNQNYTGSYAGTYAGGYTGSYTGTYAGNYTGSYIRYFSGRNAGSYSGTYTGYYTGSYSGSYTGYYTGTYTGTYTGATIMASKETLSTLKLWLRIS